jgi:hypothetical protein
MDPTTILIPMLSLAGVTFVVLLLIPFRRFRAAFRGEVVAADFKYGESERVPPEVSLPNRNLMNLLEMPLLFYVVCVTLYVTRNVDGTARLLAWTYFSLRVLHSLVHLTYNKVSHRLLPYAASNLVLAVLWLRLFLAILH